MMLSEGLILSGYPGSRKFKREANQSSAYNEEILQMALGIILNAGSKVNGTQLEFLKGALAQFQHNHNSNKSLLTAVEQILTTITNPNWVDREIMRLFFLDSAGFGSELSMSSASLCIDRGIPSPQQLAAFIFASTVNDVLLWLGITQTQFMLLKIAVGPFLEAIEKASKGNTGAPVGFTEVWVEVATPAAVDSVASSHRDDNTMEEQNNDGAMEGENGSHLSEHSFAEHMRAEESKDGRVHPSSPRSITSDASQAHHDAPNSTSFAEYDWEGSSLSSYDHVQRSPVPACTAVPTPQFMPSSPAAPLSPAGLCDDALSTRSQSTEASWVSGSMEGSQDPPEPVPGPCATLAAAGADSLGGRVSSTSSWSAVCCDDAASSHTASSALLDTVPSPAPVSAAASAAPRTSEYARFAASS